MYQEVKVHVPKEFHEKLKSLLAKDQSKNKLLSQCLENGKKFNLFHPKMMLTNCLPGFRS